MDCRRGPMNNFKTSSYTGIPIPLFLFATIYTEVKLIWRIQIKLNIIYTDQSGLEPYQTTSRQVYHKIFMPFFCELMVNTLYLKKTNEK